MRQAANLNSATQRRNYNAYVVRPSLVNGGSAPLRSGYHIESHSTTTQEVSGDDIDLEMGGRRSAVDWVTKLLPGRCVYVACHQPFPGEKNDRTVDIQSSWTPDSGLRTPIPSREWKQNERWEGASGASRTYSQPSIGLPPCPPHMYRCLFRSFEARIHLARKMVLCGSAPVMQCRIGSQAVDALGFQFYSPDNTAYQSLSRLSSILYPLVNRLGTPYHYSRRSTDPLIINYHLDHRSGCLVFVSKLSSPTYSSAVECSSKAFSPEHSIKLAELVPSHHNSNRYPPSAHSSSTPSSFVQHVIRGNRLEVITESERTQPENKGKKNITIKTQPRISGVPAFRKPFTPNPANPIRTRLSRKPFLRQFCLLLCTTLSIIPHPVPSSSSLSFASSVNFSHLHHHHLSNFRSSSSIIIGYVAIHPHTELIAISLSQGLPANSWVSEPAPLN
ncbi:hypothetical protein PGT21_032067 [Puccinia graminis f. sp. tritici]|uniref:Uncharacterized protein n=1 Tax=Puccinia graminis f. sp. tritici TaxID=56615 RepID=A0A5B0R2M6_PUCGR|nr:hypothetical protein PGT21_032067 [Puccinia graminis f. sp. tritici]